LTDEGKTSYEEFSNLLRVFKLTTETQTTMPEQQYHSSARCFAFIVNVKYYPDPFLVEMSRRTKLKKMEVGFYEPNVLYCPPEMGPILEAIIDEPEFKSLRELLKLRWYLR
jgi:hypothetical protein